MKKFSFAFFLLVLTILLTPNFALAQSGTCTCTGSINLVEVACTGQPANYCTYNNNSCGCSISLSDVIQEQCTPFLILDTLGFTQEAKDNESLSCTFTEQTSSNAYEETSSNATEESSDSSVPLENLLGVTDPNIIIGRVIKFLIGISGSAALLMLIYGGILWMISGGNAQNIDKGKKTMISAAIGLVIIFTSYILVRFILAALGAV